MDAVWESCAVNEDVFSIAMFQELHVFPEKIPIGGFLSDGCKDVADPLAFQVCFRIQYAGIASFQPFRGIVVCHVALYVVLKQGKQGILVAVVHRMDGTQKPGLDNVAVKKMRRPKIQNKFLLCILPLDDGDLGIGGWFPICVRLQVVGKNAPLAVAVNACLFVNHTAKAYLFGLYLASLTIRFAYLGILHTVLYVISYIHVVPPRCSSKHF